MSDRDGGLIRFRDFAIDTGRVQVTAGGEAVPMERRVYELVVYLIRHRNRLIEKDELLERVWEQTFVSDSAIARCVSTARRVFGDPDCIQNVYGRGYRWTVPVTVASEPSSQSPSSATLDARRGFFGRQSELELVHSLAGTAVAGVGGVCLVSGDAGIGKTRFLRAARDVAAGVGLRVVVGRCREMEGAPPYWPWSQIVRALFDSERDLPENLRSILRFDYEADPRSTSVEKSRVLVWEAVAESILGRVANVPTALLVDDLHQADTGSALLLEFVSERAAEVPLLIVATYRRLELERDAARSACVKRIIRAASPLIIELAGLGIEDTAAFLRERNGSEPAQALVAYAHELTGGNPFFLSQVAPLLGAGQVGDAKQIARILPGTVKASIQAQIERFSPACRSVLELASVIGRVTRTKVVASALNVGLDEISRCVSEARSGGLVTPSPGRVESFAFVHDLIREILYDALADEKRARLHLAVAEALERGDASNRMDLVDEIAYHFGCAGHVGGTERAIDFAMRAADAATKKFAYEAAREHLARAVALVDESHSPDQERLCSLLVDWGSSELNSGNPEAAWAIFDRALQIANQIDQRELAVRAALALTSSFHVVNIRFDPKLVDLLEALLARTDRSEPGVRALLLCRLVLAIAWLPDLGRRIALAKEARALAQGVDSARVKGSAFVAQFYALEGTADIAERVFVAEESIRLCRLAGDLQMEQFALITGIFTSLEMGRLGTAREHGRACRAVIHRLRVRDTTAQCVPLAHAGLLAHIDGRLSEMCEIADEIDAMAIPAMDLVSRTVSDSQRMFVHHEHAQAEGAMRMVSKWYEMAPGVNVWLATRILALVKTAPSDAQALLTKLSGDGFAFAPDWQWPCCMAFVALVCSDLHDAHVAPLLYEKLAPYRDRHAPVGAACFYYGSMHRYLGLLADTMGRFDLADEHLERANVIHADIGARLMHAHTLAEHAVLLERAPDVRRREKAKELRARASELADEMGLVSVQLKLGDLCDRVRSDVSGR